MQRLKPTNSGFTIVELMIATLVFSVILLLATYGILNIGRLYRKSITSSRTQQTARSIIDTVAQNLKFNGGNFVAGTNVYCLGSNKRLSLRTNVQFVNNTSHGLVIDDTTCSSTSSTQDLTQSTIAGKELLGPRMRLAKFYICDKNMGLDSNCSSIASSLKDNTYYIFLRVIYGDNDLLSPGNQNCNTNAGREFCAMSEVSTYVQKVIQ